MDQCGFVSGEGRGDNWDVEREGFQLDEKY
jgi:hypothetical protein